jgi:hypothetical protein
MALACDREVDDAYRGVRLDPISLVVLLLALVLLCGCTTQPSMLAAVVSPLPVGIRALSDYDIIVYGDVIKARWGMRSLNAEAFSTSTQVAMASLSTAAIAAAATASRGVTIGLTGAGAWFLQLFGIVKPGEKDTILSEGSGAILDAQGAYLQCLTGANRQVIPVTFMTPCGATLGVSINAAIKVTNQMLAGQWPKAGDVNKALGVRSEP